MGKSNKANRTKGNTRPSSSEHSAHLLNLSGKSVSGFIGFDSLEKDIPTYIPVTGQHTSDATDFSVDSDLRMVMRKMLKRDSVTRLKAVQEFGDLCSEKEKDDVKNVLPFWPRLFNKLALDHDRRIREATHQANGKLLSNVKREIAPYLKNIMGVWLLGQNDLHAPAASAAQSTFTATFPKAKQSEALMFCKNEIFSYFKDNLFEQTAKTMSDPNSTSAEDVENKYTLVISATFQALKLYLVTVSSKEFSNVQDDYLAIISENKFWKYAKSKEPQIRGSWYALISFLCHMKPHLFSQMEKKLINTVFSCLSENDPVVAPSVWESALHIVVNFENCWQDVNIHKVVLPQLWALLNEAGRGNAHVIYLCILPLLSKFPREVIAKDSFLLQFFTCLKNSLLLDSVKLSSMECDAILATFMECLLYIFFTILDNSKEQMTLLEKVFSDHVFPLVEASFYEKKLCHLATSKFYFLLSSLVQKLESKCLNDREDASKIFSCTLTLFWGNLYNIFCKLFDKKNEEQTRISVYVAYFFHSMFSLLPSSNKSEKSKVRFDDETNETDIPSASSVSLPPDDLYKKMPITLAQMTKFIKILCSKTDENVNLCYLKILDEILAATLNTEFLKDILKSYEASFDSCEKTSLTFFNKVILKWISSEELNPSSIVCICDIVFSLCSSVSEDEALEMLNVCCQVKNPVFLESILNKGLGLYSHEPVMQKWFKSPILIECILNGLKEMMESLVSNEIKNEEHISAYKNMLLLCLVNENFQGTLNENKSIEKILFVCKEYIQKALISANIDSIIEVCCSIIEAVLLNCEICWSYNITDDLLSLIFHWNVKYFKYGLRKQNCACLSKVWKSAVLSSYKSDVVTKKDSFIVKAAKELNSCLLCLDSSDRAGKTFYETINMLHLVEEVLTNLPANYSSTFVLSNLLENILLSDEQWELLKKSLALSSIPAILDRKIMYPFPEKENSSVTEIDILKLFLAAKVTSQIFTQEMGKIDPYEDEQYFDQYVMKQIPHLFWCLSYCTGNGFMDQDFDVDIDSRILEDHCIKILKFQPYQKLQELLNTFFYSSISTGLYWSLPFDLFIEKSKLLKPEIINLLPDLISEAMLMKSDYVSLNVQILSHHIDKEKKVFYLRNLLGDLTEKDSSPGGINDDYLRKLGEVCCFLHNAEDLDEEMKNLLSSFLSTIVSYDCPKDLKFLFSLQITTLISSIVQCSPNLVTKNLWDYLQILLSSNIEFAKSVDFDKPEDLLLLFQVSLLYSTSYSFILNTKDSENHELLSWMPTISEELNENFISLFIHIGVVIRRFKPLPQALSNALQSLLKAAEFVPKNVIFNYIMQTPVAACEDSPDNDKLLNPVDSLSTILLSDIQHLQLATHLMLIKVMPLLSESLANISKSESDDNEEEEEKIPLKLLPLVDTLKILNELMESMLGDIKIGECCLVLPDTEPYTFVSAYLFAWLQMLEFISASPSQVRSGYVANLEEEKLLSSLFLNVCRLMPDNPMSCLKKDSDTPKKENLISLFLHPPVILPGNPSPEQIQMIACYVFCSAIRKFPATVRTWWNNLEKKSADIVNKFTSKYISGILCTEEIQAVHNNENLFKNMVVKARLGSREVIATYTVDDFAIELCVQIPANYPLGPITAEKRGKIIIAQQEWRHWLMQLTTVLNYQNGSILDGLTIWKKNLDKKFEGVEECMICYYILHSSSLKLPKLSCHTCRKKFHSACLYKWFHSINNTKCPLCRNEFTI